MSLFALRPVTVADCVAEYREHVRRRKSPRTLERYIRDLELLVEWAGEERPAALSARDLENGFVYGFWANRFEERNGREPEQFKSVHTCLSGFYRYLVNQGLLVDESGKPVPNPLTAFEAPKVKRRKNDWLREADDNALLELPLPPLEGILIHFLRKTGLRLDEFLCLRVDDVDLQSRTVFVNNSKTESGIREAIIPESLVRRIKEWNAFVEAKTGKPRQSRDYFVCTTRVGRWKDSEGNVHTTEPGQKMKPQQVEKIVRRLGERVGIERLCPHRLRRTYGSRLLNDGLRLESVSALLGHADTRVTQQSYASLTPQTIRKEFMKVAG